MYSMNAVGHYVIYQQQVIRYKFFLCDYILIYLTNIKDDILILLQKNIVDIFL